MPTIKIEILSPVHIGSGDMDSFGSVPIDGELHFVDISKLADEIKEIDIKKWFANPENLYDQLRDLAKTNKEIIKKCSKFSIPISPAISENGEFKEVRLLNRNPITGKVYLPASSIKGAIRTAVEYSYVVGKNKRQDALQLIEILNKNIDKLHKKYNNKHIEKVLTMLERCIVYIDVRDNKSEISKIISTDRIEQGVKAKIDALSDPFRLLKISDSFVDTRIETAIQPISEIRCSIKQRFTKVLYENYTPNQTINLYIKFENTHTRYFKNKTIFPIITKEVINNCCREFYQTVIDKEKAFFSKAINSTKQENKRKAQMILNFYNQLEQKLSDSKKIPLRIGGLTKNITKRLLGYGEPILRWFNDEEGKFKPLGWCICEIVDGD